MILCTSCFTEVLFCHDSWLVIFLKKLLSKLSWSILNRIKCWCLHQPCCAQWQTQKCLFKVVLALLSLYGDACGVCVCAHVRARIYVCMCVRACECISPCWHLGVVLRWAESHWQLKDVGSPVFTQVYDFNIRLLDFWNEKIQLLSQSLRFWALSSSDQWQVQVKYVSLKHGNTHHLLQVGLDLYSWINLNE